MYDKLIESLRLCVKYGKAQDALENAEQAADAIEELSNAGSIYGKAWTLGYDAGRDENRPRWIPVTEQLPVGGDDSGAVCENVCLMMDDGTVSCGWMNGITKKVYYLNARDDFIIKAPITRVTHWMPLPTPPTAEEGET